MRLVYNDYGNEVKIGDVVTLRDGEKATVEFFREPHKPASSGKVNVTVRHGDHENTAEYFVGVIGAKWIEREDRA
jgi:hypothetical protein